MLRGGRGIDIIWLLAFGLASSLWCWTAAAELGVTFDEPMYLNAGLTSWRTGSNKLLMSAGTMPLAVDAETLPVYLWEQWRGAEFHPYQDIATILPVARAANLVFWWLLLAYAMRLGRTWGGAWAGRLAVALIACDPNFLGHASLATTDIAAVATMLVLIYHYYHGLSRDWGRRVLVPGICFGVAMLAKASGMVFGVQAMLGIAFCHLLGAGGFAGGPGLREKALHAWRVSYPLRKDLVWIGLIGFVVVFAYTGSDCGTEWTFIAWAEQLPDGPLRSAMVPISHNLSIFPNAGEALVQQIKHNLRGHGTYLLGEWHHRAHWSYFPLALSMKTPAPALVLLLAMLALRPRDFNTPVGWIAFGLLTFSLNCRVQIGIRFMFTLMATTYLAMAIAIARGWRDQAAGIAGWRVLPRWFVTALIATTAAASITVWPHGISFFNRMWGGPEQGYRYLHDSNYDWGQGLPELKRWHEAHGGGRPLAVWYYGTDPAILFPPFRWVNFSFTPLNSGDDIPGVVGDGYLAVSVGALYGNTTATPSTRIAVEWLREQQPVGRTHTFVIYDLRPREHRNYTK
jgi:hypothetical protein